MRDVYLVYYYIYSPNSLFNQYLIFISYVQTKLVRFCRVINQVIRVMCCMFSVSASVRPASACGVFQHSLTSHASSIQRFCVCYTRKTICSPLSIAAQTSRRAARAVGHSRRMTDTTPLLCCACVSPCIHPRDRSSTPLLCAVFVCSKRRRPSLPTQRSRSGPSFLTGAIRAIGVTPSFLACHARACFLKCPM